MCEVQSMPWMNVSSDGEDYFIPPQDYSSEDDIVESPELVVQQEVAILPEEVAAEIIDEAIEDVKDVVAEVAIEHSTSKSPTITPSPPKQRNAGPPKKKGSKKTATHSNNGKKSVGNNGGGKKVFKDHELAFLEKLIKENEKAPPIPRKVPSPPPAKNDDNLKDLRAKLRAKINGRESNNSGPKTVVLTPNASKSAHQQSKSQSPEMPPFPTSGGYLKASGVGGRKIPGTDSNCLMLLRKYEPYISRGEITADKAVELANAGISPDDTVYANLPHPKMNTPQDDEDMNEVTQDMMNQYGDLLSAEGEMIRHLDPNDPRSLERLTEVRNQLKESQSKLVLNLVDFFLRETTYGNTLGKINEYERKFPRSVVIERSWKDMCKKVYCLFHEKFGVPGDLRPTPDHPIEELFYEYVLKQYVGDSVRKQVEDMDAKGVFETYTTPFALVGMQKSELDVFPRMEFIVPLQQMVDLKLFPANIGNFAPFGQKPMVFAMFWSMSSGFNMMGTYYRYIKMVDDVPVKSYRFYWFSYNRLAPVYDIEPFDFPQIQDFPPPNTINIMEEVNGDYSPEKDLAKALADSARGKAELESSESSSETDMDLSDVDFVVENAVVVRNRKGVAMAEITFRRNAQENVEVNFHFDPEASKDYRRRVVQSFNKALAKKCRN